MHPLFPEKHDRDSLNVCLHTGQDRNGRQKL